MTDQLTSAALVGTGRAVAQSVATGTPLDALADGLIAITPERKILLAAGALAVYRMAGTMPAQGSDVPPLAEPETQPICSQAAADLLRPLFSRNYPQLLPEALERLRVAGQVIPPELVPLALDSLDRALASELRPALQHVLGARGRWISQFNKAWSWVGMPIEDGDMLPPNAEMIWQESPIAQRAEMLRRQRLADPATGRAWIEAVWKQERADARADLLDAFATRLSDDDIPFLEVALKDRVENIRQHAAQLLAQCPTSALAQRVQQRAMAMISYEPATDDHEPTLRVQPPIFIDDADAKEWERDGLSTQQPRGVGKRSWWLTQVLEYVPPAHWERTFGATPQDLITAAATTEYESALIEGWTVATQRFDAVAWVRPLFDWWVQLEHTATLRPLQYGNIRNNLFAQLPRDEAEGFVARCISDSSASDNASWEGYILALPRPWSASISDTYIEALKSAIADLLEGNIPSNLNIWTRTLENAAAYMGIDSLQHLRSRQQVPTATQGILEDFTEQRLESHQAVPTPTSWAVRYFSQQYDTFMAMILIRQRLAAEIR